MLSRSCAFLSSRLLAVCVPWLLLSSAHGFEFDTFGDGFWRIIIRANSAALIADGNGTSHPQDLPGDVVGYRAISPQVCYSLR